MTVTHGSPPYIVPGTKKRYYKDYDPVQRKKMRSIDPQVSIDLTTTSDLQLWNVFHSQLSATNLPPDNVILADADVAALMMLSKKGEIKYSHLHNRWPTTFDISGRPLLRRKPYGMPVIAHFKGDETSPEGYYYLCCEENYTLCGQDYVECTLPDHKRTSSAARPPYPWQQLVDQHSYRGSYPGRKTQYLTIERHVPVNWNCIVPPKVISWDHMSQAYITVILKHPTLFPPEIVRLCLESDDKNGKRKTEARRPRDVSPPVDAVDELVRHACCYPGLAGVILYSAVKVDSALALARMQDASQAVVKAEKEQPLVAEVAKLKADLAVTQQKLSTMEEQTLTETNEHNRRHQVVKDEVAILTVVRRDLDNLVHEWRDMAGQGLLRKLGLLSNRFGAVQARLDGIVKDNKPNSATARNIAP
ncbi:hypothetical protein AMS68_007629 [Peltaster fructicola]|uniref:Uncharacterized protein n=1 Tax=Peltaster fructicola TaxID=286661 RepID=A0A6H0Y4Z7_9PEZI|nr:hypothetical protein AMS68_007629 [Peltaster fructicola]